MKYNIRNIINFLYLPARWLGRLGRDKTLELDEKHRHDGTSLPEPSDPAVAVAVQLVRFGFMI